MKGAVVSMIGLETVRDLKARIATAEERLACFRAIPMTPKIDGMPKAKGRTSTTEKIALRIVESERELETLRSEFSNAQDKLLASILDNVSNPVSATAMMFRYVACWTLDRIAERLNCSRKTVIRHIRQGEAEYNLGGSDNDDGAAEKIC